MDLKEMRALLGVWVKKRRTRNGVLRIWNVSVERDEPLNNFGLYAKGGMRRQYAL